VDGVALAPHRQVDVKALDVDFYVSTSLRSYSVLRMTTASSSYSGVMKYKVRLVTNYWIPL